MSRWRCTWTKLAGNLEAVVEQQSRTDRIEFSWLVMRTNWRTGAVINSLYGIASTLEEAQQKCEESMHELAGYNELSSA